MPNLCSNAFGGMSCSTAVHSIESVVYITKGSLLLVPKFNASGLLSSIPVTLYCEVHVHRQGLEDRFGMLAEYSYSPENIRKRQIWQSLNKTFT